MASNALSSRRGLLRRPKVCKTPMNPGRCHPPSRIACSILPNYFTIFQMHNQQLRLTHCNVDDYSGRTISVELSATLGHFFNHGPMQNCVVDPAHYAPDLVGDYVLTMEVMFEDMSTCVVNAFACVIPNPP